MSWFIVYCVGFLFFLLSSLVFIYPFTIWTDENVTIFDKIEAVGSCVLIAALWPLFLVFSIGIVVLVLQKTDLSQ